ncbi:hypothetical protein [Streptomyces xiamenensis]|uniref:hypothetical protein n=1 Tax=Streptomyces xiamenensis TaxID=408015 RepID=UPI0035DEE8A2
MSDLPSDLPRLQVLRTWLAVQLRAVDAEIAAAEARQAAAAAAPVWWVQWHRRRIGRARTGVLHRVGCWLPGEPDLTGEQLEAVLAEHGARIERCPACTTTNPPTGPVAG